jgi:hypothetical protein
MFYTIDTYGTFSADLLDDDWFEESEFNHEQYVKDLAELHAEVINGVLPAGGINSVRVVGTSSPMWYNFATDEADLEIDVDIDHLLRYLQMHDNEKEFDKFLHERFTDRDGFMSYTTNNIKEFYQVLDREHEMWNQDIDHDKHVGVLVGWYLERECLTGEEYLDEMYNGVHEILWNNFEQFTTETWREYTKYEDEFNRKEAEQTTLFPRSKQYPLEIQEWYKKYKEPQYA